MMRLVGRTVSLLLLGLACCGRARAQEFASPSPGENAPTGTISNEELLLEMRRLRAEVEESRKLKDQVTQLQSELSTLRENSGSPAFGPGPGVSLASFFQSPGEAMNRGGQPAAIFGRGGTGPNAPGFNFSEFVGGQPGFMQGSPTGGDAFPYAYTTPPGAGNTGPSYGGPGQLGRGGQPPIGGAQSEDDFKLNMSYRYSSNATGPLGGGGYFHVSDENDEFSVNLTNQITVDSTNFDRQNMPTIEQGFNIPFARTFIYGNITKDWNYQIGTQGFLGTFNLLDMWMTYKVANWLSIRAGKGLAPPLYEYYAFTPALEAVITNSPLFQLAAGRPVGVMASGNVLDNRLQYWFGVNNIGKSVYYGLNRNVEFDGVFTITPFKGREDFLDGLGGGLGYSSAWEQFRLQQTSINFAQNGEASTNGAFVTSSGVPFFVYNPNVFTTGQKIRVAPHLFWYGRLSFLGEYMLFSRMLSDGTTTGRSTQRGYYLNLSYFLTGERDFRGNGFQGYSTINPISPFIPSRNQWGPGAWQIATQWSELNVGDGDFRRGFADGNRWTNRMDQLMAGVNWWPNKYTRISAFWVWTGFNRAIPLNSPEPVSTFNTAWLRFAMYF